MKVTATRKCYQSIPQETAIAHRNGTFTGRYVFPLSSCCIKHSRCVNMTKAGLFTSAASVLIVVAMHLCSTVVPSGMPSIAVITIGLATSTVCSYQAASHFEAGCKKKIGLT